MAENTRTPVAIRLVRPYENEEQFLANELETVGKTSVILIGAHPRPTGVILRFEVTLAGGGTVLRGEGRVLAHKENAFRGQPGLALRFTRLDPKSKALVDRATAIREAKANGDADPMSARPISSAANPVVAPLSAPTLPDERPSAPAPEPATAPPPAEHRAHRTAEERWRNEAPTATGDVSAVAEALSQTPEPPREVDKIRRRRTSRPPEPEQQMTLLDAVPETQPEPQINERPDLDLTPSEPREVHEVRERAAPIPPPTRPPSVAPSPMAVSHAPSHTQAVEAPPDKEALLSRLRERAGKLSSERVAQILATRT